MTKYKGDGSNEEDIAVKGYFIKNKEVTYEKNKKDYPCFCNYIDNVVGNCYIGICIYDFTNRYR